ncbi:RUN domain containing protein [Acanthamoeba castellanii str. Neff]|uniref:RUN domain containing protein n=1 Tax=Acanthamoeba castellanii (strain ATCC 30010 / Neff) TaxID=1257118 RepID=L8GIA9_ACACF|nr:RUN domain containing protein [Acanthamoeba castellanii str. Neff]ELR12488.1 RUN domain containing protein [Acanthamoeba castellanii str. Neff]
MNDSHMEAKRLQEAAFNTLHAILDTTGSSETINASMEQYNHFFCVVENILGHGMKHDKKSFWASKPEPRDFFDLLECLPKVWSQGKKVMDVVNNFPTAKTSKGKGRLWLRIALKEKNLKTLLTKLTQDQSLLRKFYEDDALLRNNDQLEMFLGILSPLEVLNVPVTFRCGLGL